MRAQARLNEPIRSGMADEAWSAVEHADQPLTRAAFDNGTCGAGHLRNHRRRGRDGTTCNGCAIGTGASGADHASLPLLP
jgi:hypothetical protein